MVGRGMGGVGQGAGLCRMHVFTFASATPSVTRTTALTKAGARVCGPTRGLQTTVVTRDHRRLR